VKGGLRARIAVTAVAATAAALLAVFLLVGPAVRGESIADSREALLSEAALMASFVEEPLAAGAATAALDAIVDEAARQSGGRRFTIVAPDGRVLADSAASGAELAALDNHAGRPEVQGAVTSGRGAIIRHSATVGDDLLYVAVPIRRGGRLLGVSRVARSIGRVEQDVARLRRAITSALAVAFLVTTALALALSASLGGPLRAIMDSARRFAAGDLEARARVERDDEIGELARILNDSADQLQSRLVELARERARADAILSSMEEGLLAVDHRGVVLLANESLSTALGLRDPVGRHYLEAVRHREVAALVEEVLRTGQRLEAEVDLHHLRRVYALAAGPFPGVEGAPHGGLVTFHDITHARRLDQVRRDFVANASHELRTPLTSIRGFVEALEDGALSEPERGQRFLGKIRVHAERMATLVADLLELSRLEAGERQLEVERLDPAEVAEDVALSLEKAAAERRVTVSVTGREKAEVETDREALRRILDNLVENGVKYTREGGRVDVRVAATAEGGATVEVADDGPGIAPEHLTRIFERFYRVDKARSREVGGTGLGLSIVRHLAESLSAKVAVESAAGRGARFILTLPAAPKAG
jgi:two-component system, OmpR family, phosphate regulon sensor histidine kinase PhoR